jgi:hypothetical protein
LRIDDPAYEFVTPMIESPTISLGGLVFGQPEPSGTHVIPEPPFDIPPLRVSRMYQWNVELKHHRHFNANMVMSSSLMR